MSLQSPTPQHRIAGLLLASAVVCGSAACSHDWDAWMPPAGSGASNTTGSTNTGSSTNAGGGGAAPTAHCPESKDGADMVLVQNPGKPSVFECVDTTEVTRSRYEIWLASATNPDSMPSACAFDTLDHVPQSYWPPNGLDLDHPVTFVDWCDAYAYCATIGKRLCGRFEGGNVPTQSHLDPKTDAWFAACSSGGTQQFPYGDKYAATKCNGADLNLKAATPVGNLKGCVTPGGAFDMSGNVWEWEDSCAGTEGADDMCMMRGGGYLNYQDNLACTASSQGKRKSWSVSIGFRCCVAGILDIN